MRADSPLAVFIAEIALTGPHHWIESMTFVKLGEWLWKLDIRIMDW